MDPIPKHQKKLPPVIVAMPAPPPIPLIAGGHSHAPEAEVAANEPDTLSAKVAAARHAHPSGPANLEWIVIAIIGITACDQGRSCEEHSYCGEVIDGLHRVQVIMPSKNGRVEQEVTAVMIY